MAHNAPSWGRTSCDRSRTSKKFVVGRNSRRRVIGNNKASGCSKQRIDLVAEVLGGGGGSKLGKIYRIFCRGDKEREEGRWWRKVFHEGQKPS